MQGRVLSGFTKTAFLVIAKECFTQKPFLNSNPPWSGTSLKNGLFGLFIDRVARTRVKEL